MRVKIVELTWTDPKQPSKHISFQSNQSSPVSPPHSQLMSRSLEYQIWTLGFMQRPSPRRKQRPARKQGVSLVGVITEVLTKNKQNNGGLWVQLRWLLFLNGVRVLQEVRYGPRASFTSTSIVGHSSVIIQDTSLASQNKNVSRRHQ